MSGPPNPLSPVGGTLAVYSELRAAANAYSRMPVFRMTPKGPVRCHPNGLIPHEALARAWPLEADIYHQHRSFERHVIHHRAAALERQIAIGGRHSAP